MIKKFFMWILSVVFSLFAWPAISSDSFTSPHTHFMPLSQQEYPSETDVVFITDNNYVLPTVVAITSLKKNTNVKKIYVVFDNLTDENKNLLSKTGCKLIEHKNALKRYDKTHHYVSAAALSKFDLPDIFKKEDKILYLDADMIIQSDLTELLETDLQNHYAAVVKDMACMVDDCQGKVGLKKYFNSGMMLLNLKKMREDNVVQKLYEYKEYKDRRAFMDQDCLNAIFNDNVLFLSPKYNWMGSNLLKFSADEIKSFFDLDEDVNMQNAAIVHLTNQKKPWHYRNAYGYELWKKYYKISPISHIKIQYSDEEKSSIWIVFALFASIISAFYYLSAQNVKINANVFMLYRGWSITIILLPFLLFNPVLFPTNFYIMSVLQGGIVAYTDYLSFRINRTYGSETVSSITPFSVIIIFFAWCLIDTSIIEKYTENPLNTLMILLALCGVMYALFNYRKTDLSRKAFILLIPVLFLSSGISVLNKMIMSYSGENQLICAVWRTWILSLIIGLVHIIIYIRKKLRLKDLFDCKMLSKSLIFVLLLSVMIFKSLAMYYAENPAYVVCIVYTTFLWIIFISKHIKMFEFKRKNLQIKKRWEILFVISVIALILATR
ncbi:MAG: glycosyltransferase family 8 protein [Alphaproteobacteria bacterium]|nr:glycosyltransferase family 8 protein [Alphaproteobacteria bacterium]